MSYAFSDRVIDYFVCRLCDNWPRAPRKSASEIWQRIIIEMISMTPIGVVRSTRKKVEDDNWDAEKMSVELDAKQFGESALAGLSEFSHVEVIFYMNQVEASKIEAGARHPRNNISWPSVGIFAQRAKNRPNRIGATICKVLSVDGRILNVEGLDAVDGTPVLDIKPWVAEFAPRGTQFQPKWISELMQGYWSSQL
jgi:tRNA-Thr(GGU) m(6)t(6)A37 methyltransferase TsaA